MPPNPLTTTTNSLNVEAQMKERVQEDRQAALQAWSHYQATGLHISGDEADAWLARLEAGQYAKTPECHI